MTGVGSKNFKNTAIIFAVVIGLLASPRFRLFNSTIPAGCAKL